MIPPLVPLPPSFKPEHDPREDLFATLFAPSTPRASPNLGPVSDDQHNDTPILPSLPSRHSRTASADSDFGAFVSISSTEDPLSPPVQGSSSGAPFSPLQNLEFFDRFAEEAKAATERNKKGVLDELLEHEDDPLYFLQTPDPPAHAPLERSTPVPPSTLEQPSLIDLSPTAEFWNSASLPEVVTPPQNDDGQPSDDADNVEGRSSRHNNKTEPATLPTHVLRSPSLPPSPARASEPELQPSLFTSSSFTSATFPKKWVSSLLSRPSQRRTASADEVERSSSAVRHSPSSSASSIISHSRMHSALETSTAITHGTPFASEPYIPPSGAPGFSGDRTWNTGGFEFDKENVEKKSVRLVGRKELTTPVLTAEIADMVSHIDRIGGNRV